jgi:hypothetical protein
MTCRPRTSRLIALALVATFALPTLAVTTGCGPKNVDNTTTTTSPSAAPDTMASQPAKKAGMTTKQKVVLLAGAALLFYLYKRYQAQNAATAQNGTGGKPQLYREEKGPNKGAIYYRKNDANHTVVWLQAPAQGVRVPADQVQQYLPNYASNPNAYQGQVNTNPDPSVNNGTAESADQYAGAAQ